MDDDPQGLRARAVRLFAMAIHVRDNQPGYADKLVAEAMELQDRATAMAAATCIDRHQDRLGRRNSKSKFRARRKPNRPSIAGPRHSRVGVGVWSPGPADGAAAGLSCLALPFSRSNREYVGYRTVRFLFAR
jgi:hypothetical protein